LPPAGGRDEARRPTGAARDAAACESRPSPRRPEDPDRRRASADQLRNWMYPVKMAGRLGSRRPLAGSRPCAWMTAPGITQSIVPMTTGTLAGHATLRVALAHR